MQTTDILIIGGGPAGIISAVTARKNNPTKKITLIRKEQKSIIPCGIPYIFNRLKSVEEDIAPDASLQKNKVKIIIDTVGNLNTKNKVIFTKSKKKIKYDKLILATGSGSIKIPIKGIDKQGVWYINKNLNYLKKMREAILKAKNIVIIGGGYIGVELAEELSTLKFKKIHIIEKAKYCLGTTLSKEFAIHVQESLKNLGLNIHTNKSVAEIKGNRNVESVKLSDGKQIPADLIIISIGAKPNIELAQNAEIKINQYGEIKVDSYMKTSNQDIFAVGDCAETKDFFSGSIMPVMLASTACYEARIAGSNLYKKNNLIKNHGTLAAFSTYINNETIGVVGLNEETAKKYFKKEKIIKNNIISGSAECPCAHPEKLQGTAKIKLQLIFSKTNGLLLGGQVIGPKSSGELINTIALGIQKKINIYDLIELQIATHPLLTPAPTIYPLITAAQSALSKIKNGKK